MQPGIQLIMVSVIFAIYIDSIVFIIATNILSDGYGVNLNGEICASTIILCLTCYLSTKVCIPIAPKSSLADIYTGGMCYTIIFKMSQLTVLAYLLFLG